MEVYFGRTVKFFSLLLLVLISLIFFKQDVERKMKEHAKSYLLNKVKDYSGAGIGEFFIYY